MRAGGNGWRRHRLLGLVVGALLTLTACRAAVDVDVDVAADGSGTVTATATLDREAAEQLLDLDLEASGLPLADLAQAGWDVEPPDRRSDGSVVVTASKAFGTAEQFAEIMEELSGPEGVYVDFELERIKSFARVDYAVTGTLDTTGGFATFGDAELDSALGRPLGQLAAELGADEASVDLGVTVSVPGDLQGTAPSGLLATDDESVRARWSANLADNEEQPVELASATREVTALVLRGVAIVAGVLAALVVFAQLLRVVFPDRRRRRRRSPRPGRPTPEAAPSPRPAPEPAPAATDRNADRRRVVALDAMGVLYREADDVGRVLIPFIREHGSPMPNEDIEARVRQVVLGRMTTAEFWRAVGVAGEPDALDEAYVARRQLMPGVVKYLRSLRRRGLRIACVTNDATSWASKSRARHNLDGLIDPWVISSSVGVAKPDEPIYEVLRRLVSQPGEAVVVVDNDLDVLDAVRSYGFSTTWYDADGSDDDSRGHDVLRSFEAEEPLPDSGRSEAEAP